MTENNKQKYCYSLTEELFYGEDCYSKEEALFEAIKSEHLDVGDTVYIGEQKNVHTFDFINTWDVQSLLETMQEHANDEAGEAADTWPNLRDEQIEELTEIIKNYVHLKDPATFYSVEVLEEIKITQEHMDKYKASNQ